MNKHVNSLQLAMSAGADPVIVEGGPVFLCEHEVHTKFWKIHPLLLAMPTSVCRSCMSPRYKIEGCGL